MRRCIIGLFDGDPNGDELQIEGTSHLGIDAAGYDYLDNAATIYWGEAASQIETDTEEITFTASNISRETIPRSKTVATNFFGDLDAGFVTIDSSDGTFLWNHLALRHETDIRRAELDLDSWEDELASLSQSRCWQLGWDHPEREDVGVAFHDGAEFGLNGRVTQLGFEYLWNGSVVRGTAAQSGYVAVFDGVSRPSEVGRWLRDEILPHAFIPEDDEESEQATLDSSAEIDGGVSD